MWMKTEAHERINFNQYSKCKIIIKFQILVSKSYYKSKMKFDQRQKRNKKKNEIKLSRNDES